MRTELQLCHAIYADGRKVSLKGTPSRALGLTDSFRWNDPEGLTKEAIMRFVDAIGGFPILNVRVTCNPSFGYAEITADGFHARWQNVDRPLVMLSDDEKIDLYCDAERYFLGDCFSQKALDSL